MEIAENRRKDSNPIVPIHHKFPLQFCHTLVEKSHIPPHPHLPPIPPTKRNRIEIPKKRSFHSLPIKQLLWRFHRVDTRNTRFELHHRPISSRTEILILSPLSGGRERIVRSLLLQREGERERPFRKGNLFETFLAVFFGTKNGVTWAD